MGDLVLDKLDFTGNDWLTIAIAFVAYFIFSFLWWGPLMGKRWAMEMGMDPNMKPDGKTMGKAMILQVLGTFLMAMVFFHIMEAFTYNVVDGTDGITWGHAMTGAFFMWLGFVLPHQFGKISWENGTWVLFGINSVGHLIGLMVMAAIFVIF